MYMNGRVCLVTGANTGHGKAVAAALAKIRGEVAELAEQFPLYGFLRA